MKANVYCGAVALLFVVACSRPDTDLFGADGFQPVDNQAGTASIPAGGGSSIAGAAASTGGGTVDAAPDSGGTANNPATGGSSLVAGAPAAGGGVGGSSLPDNQAGAPDGAAGTPEPQHPAEPVCGNGILETGEACDDAGHAGKDGCSADCKVACADFGADAIESEEHHCYNGYDQANFEAAQAACVKRGGHLASLTSAAENKLARSLVDGSKWIGGREDVPLSSPGAGAYTWLTGEAFSYTNWADQEPNRRDPYCGMPFGTACYQHCISLLGDGTWAAARCDMVDGYICEWDPAGTKP